MLTGRDGIFSAGFDLTVLTAGGPDAVAMLRAGFELAERLLSFPTPVLIACTGPRGGDGRVPALLSGDYRVGAAGPYKITANEVAIGLTMPRAAVEICRQRLTPAHFNRAVILAEVFSPDDAVAAGFLDRVVPAAELHDVARSAAAGWPSSTLDAHAATKLRARDRRAATRSGRPSKPTTPTSVEPCRRGAAGVRRAFRVGRQSCRERSSAPRSCETTCCRSRSRRWPTDGIAGFTTRRVAQEAETSTPAVYELFGDKAGLVREVFFEGFRLLRRRFDELDGHRRSARRPGSHHRGRSARSSARTRCWPR